MPSTISGVPHSSPKICASRSIAAASEQVEALADRAQRRGERARSVREALAEPLLRARQQRVGLDDFVHEPDRERALRRDVSAVQDQLGRHRRVRPGAGAAACRRSRAGCRASPRAGRTSPWSTRCARDRRARARVPPPSAKPFTAATTGLSRFSMRANTAWPRRANSTPLSRVELGDLVDRGARDERAARAGDDRGANTRLALDARDRARRARRSSVDRERVQRLGPVHRERRDAVLDRDFDQRHRSRPRRRPARAAARAACGAGTRRPAAARGSRS